METTAVLAGRYGFNRGKEHGNCCSTAGVGSRAAKGGAGNEYRY